MKNLSLNRIIKIIILFLTIAAAFWLGRHFGLQENLSPQKIRDFILGFGIWAPVIYILIYVLRVFILFSASILSIAGGLAFGPFLGTIYTVIGASLSSAVAFLLARWLGRSFIDAVCKSCGPAIKDIDEKIGNKGFWVILFLRLVPIFPYEGINFAAGLSKMNFWAYFWGTVLGIIPGAFAYNYLGGSLLNIKDLKILLAIALVLILISIPTVYKMVMGRRRNP